MRGEAAAADDDELLSNKLKQLREIRLAGLEVIHVIHRHGIADEKTAYEVEAALIDAYRVWPISWTVLAVTSMALHILKN